VDGLILEISMEPQGSKVFFSYARADSEFVLKLAEKMRSAGVDLWIDQLDIPTGARWDQTVGDALKSCPCLLVILSPTSVASENVMDEVAYAIDQKKKILPVLHQNCDIPFRINRLQHIDFVSDDYDIAFTKLLKAIGTDTPDNRKEVDSTKLSLLQRIANKRYLVVLSTVIVLTILSGGLVANKNIISDSLRTTPSSCAARQGYPLGRWGIRTQNADPASYSMFVTFTGPSSGTWLPSPGNGYGRFETSMTPTPGKSLVLTYRVERGSYNSKNNLVVSADGCNMTGTYLDSADVQGEVFYKWLGD
jgi:hypothetical protein